MEEVLSFTPAIRDTVREVLRLPPDPYSRIVDAAVSTAHRVIRRLPRPRVAVLLDDVFQAIGVGKAEAHVKTLLNLIEHPPASYERIVVIVSSSEGVTMERVGRHSWANIFVLWNMPRRGFEKLYSLLPDPKPSPEDAWRRVGGNPRYLELLFRAGWSVERLVDDLAEDRRLAELVRSLTAVEREVLWEAIEDPDVLLERYGDVEGLVHKLVERNLIVRVKRRDPSVWIDEPPPERDPGLGIGRFYAWQTPLHREAVRRALEQVV